MSAHHYSWPDQPNFEELNVHFSKLVQLSSWSAVEVDHDDLQFFRKHMLERDWSWLNIIKAPKIQSPLGILGVTNVERLVDTKRKLH